MGAGHTMSMTMSHIAHVQPCWALWNGLVQTICSSMPVCTGLCMLCARSGVSEVPLAARLKERKGAVRALPHPTLGKVPTMCAL